MNNGFNQPYAGPSHGFTQGPYNPNPFGENYHYKSQQDMNRRMTPPTGDDQARALGLPPLPGSDRELLMLAAKAAGIGWPQPVWNPLTDDGDALRLAVKLRFDVCTSDGIGCVGDARSVEWLAHENLGTAPGAAIRRAIVRAAAEIGKQQPE
jgi:hypothetical protein